MDNKPHVMALGEHSQAAGNDIYNQRTFIENPIFQVAAMDYWSMESDELLSVKQDTLRHYQRANTLRRKGGAVMAVLLITLATPAFLLITYKPSPYVVAGYIFALLFTVFFLLHPAARRLDFYGRLTRAYDQQLEAIEHALFERGLEESSWVNRLFKS